jgi:alpha-galactosidase
MEALATGRPFRFMGNVYNDGYIDNLPRDSCVEVPAFADDTGIRATRLGALPPQCAAACMTNINVQQLTVEAALTGDPEHIVHALALDPLTAAVCTLRQIREMATEMLEAQRRWLPEFTGRSIRPTPAISIPSDVVPVQVPLDPALAIHQRFGKLVEQNTDP